MNTQRAKIRPLFNLIKQYSTEASSVSSDVKTMIRVNLAGETGADKIYAGQMAVLGENSLLTYFAIPHQGYQDFLIFL